MVMNSSADEGSASSSSGHGSEAGRRTHRPLYVVCSATVGSQQLHRTKVSCTLSCTYLGHDTGSPMCLLLNCCMPKMTVLMMTMMQFPCVLVVEAARGCACDILTCLPHHCCSLLQWALMALLQCSSL